MKSIEEIKKEILLKIMSGGRLSVDCMRILPKDDELRTFMCELRPMYAYWYAYFVDQSPRDDTRTAACKDPEYAYKYAGYIDNFPREDTRKGACRDPIYAYGYAHCVDESPHEETRKAAYRDPYYKQRYIKRFGE